MNVTDQYGLLVAAFCHDLGHFGKNNPFLIESGHAMAIRYNDKSPLENMHAAKLFELCQNPETNVFGKATKDMAKECRKVCVATILHTDLSMHFGMVKDLAQIYELTEAICEEQAAVEDGSLLPAYQADVLEKNKLTILELFLHQADIANSCKPWQICEKWADRVLAEFFDQGDEEKR
eukprot:TRINITY_DN19331_c0_g1_i2.p1 TRINITY_DN19331_c0_g1~~TRINITY_DN19331_c0_g1_i2.p1  ORF type:complete len:178 (-),score=37.94 TRINITY_DN19331_c0_g1_i2:204-737(-)